MCVCVRAYPNTCTQAHTLTHVHNHKDTHVRTYAYVGIPIIPVSSMSSSLLSSLDTRVSVPVLITLEELTGAWRSTCALVVVVVVVVVVVCDKPLTPIRSGDSLATPTTWVLVFTGATEPK